MKDLTKYFIDLSKLSEEQVRILNQVTNGYVNQISEFPLLFWDETEWNQTQKGDKLNTKGKTELLYPEFIRLFEGGEGETPEPTAQLKADKEELLEALEDIVNYGGIANFDTLKSLIQKMKP